MPPVKALLLPAVKAQPAPNVIAFPNLLTMGQDAALETDPHVHILDQLEPTGMDVEEKTREAASLPLQRKWEERPRAARRP